MCHVDSDPETDFGVGTNRHRDRDRMRGEEMTKQDPREEVIQCLGVESQTETPWVGLCGGTTQ